MRVIAALLVSAVLLGCSTTAKLERLEAEAERTGDWSEVYKYQEILAKYEYAEGRSCPDGSAIACNRRPGGQTCQCVSKASLNRELYDSVF